MSNYEWEKQYSKQRIEARMREAELQRQAADGQTGSAERPLAPRRNLLVVMARGFMRLFPARRPIN